MAIGAGSSPPDGYRERSGKKRLRMQPLLFSSIEFRFIFYSPIAAGISAIPVSTALSRAYPLVYPQQDMAVKPEIPCIQTKNAYNSASLRSDRGDLYLNKT
jgi:hypothetical protein